MDEESAPAIDWRGMFRRYSETVGECEGVSFLYESDWSPEEWAAIGALTADLT